MSSTSLNGLCGDFVDGTNGANPDYVFDNNGNLLIDLNKNLQSLNNGAPGTNGVHYNYMDKPDQIRLVGQGTIDIVYSADGAQLQRTFIPETAGQLSTLTTYIGDFVYQSRGTMSLTASIPYTAGSADTLDYINFEEGRIRVMTPLTGSNGYDGVTEAGNLTLPQSTLAGVWDYFVRDYQQNVRMVLTEEIHNAINRCTMETNRAAAEDPVFGQTGSGNEVEVTRTAVPSGWTNNTSASCSQLGNLAGHTIGPNSLHHVMAGDLINTSVLYYYAGSSTSSNPNIIPTILTSLASAINGPSSTGTLVHGEASSITNNLGNNSAFINAVEPSNSTSGTPQAYLTVLFFDERFNPVPSSDGGVLQLQVASTWTTSTPALGWNNIKVPKNGYVYIYVSNRSDQSVYFDNLAISITIGNIAEEDHYYPFGLKIASISSRRLTDANEGIIKNNYLYNEKEFVDDGGLNWYEFGFRNYDPQIGRFAESDPLKDDYPTLSPYLYASDDPIGNRDWEGLFGESILSTGFDDAKVLTEAVVTAHIVKSASTAGNFVHLGLSITSLTLHGLQLTSSILNTSFASLNKAAIASAAVSSGGGCCKEWWDRFSTHWSNNWSAEWNWAMNQWDQLKDKASYNLKHWQNMPTVKYFTGMAVDLYHHPMQAIAPPAMRGVQLEEEMLIWEYGEQEGWTARRIMLEANKFRGKLGEEIATDWLNTHKAADEIVISQVEGTLEDGSATKIDDLVYNTKTGKVTLINETKTGGAEFSDAQAKALSGKEITISKNAADPRIRGLKISSKNIPYRITRLDFLTGEFKIWEAGF